MSQQINLFNAEAHLAKQTFSVTHMLQGVGVVMLCFVFYYCFVIFQSNQLDKKLLATNKGLETEQIRLAGLTTEFSRQHAGLTLDQELKKISDELAAQHEIIHSLKSGVIGNTQGYAKYMQAYARQIVNGLWLTGFSIEGDATQMSISGAALSPELVPGYIMRLNHEAVMRGKTFTALNMQLPKADVAKSAMAQFLEFTLLSVAATETINHELERK